MKIVPADSPWYSKAYKQLNQRKPAAGVPMIAVRAGDKPSENGKFE